MCHDLNSLYQSSSCKHFVCINKVNLWEKRTRLVVAVISQFRASNSAHQGELREHLPLYQSLQYGANTYLIQGPNYTRLY